MVFSIYTFRDALSKWFWINISKTLELGVLVFIIDDMAIEIPVYYYWKYGRSPTLFVSHFGMFVGAFSSALATMVKLACDQSSAFLFGAKSSATGSRNRRSVSLVRLSIVPNNRDFSLLRKGFFFLMLPRQKWVAPCCWYTSWRLWFTLLNLPRKKK